MKLENEQQYLFNHCYFLFVNCIQGLLIHWPTKVDYPSYKVIRS